MLMFPLSVKLSTGVQSVYVQKQKTRIENMISHISRAGHLRDKCSPALLPKSLILYVYLYNSEIVIVQVKGL